MIVFTRHALERMRQRGITEREIETVLANVTTATPPEQNNDMTAQRRFGGRVLRVHFRVAGSDKLVITAYWTSKLSKYGE
ncbi:MAG: DUF4258 domain-containing protein [Candidatus Thorarchaeota archaeon]|nr:DUF4258 domain-containing protein [Candidatus Thorarchaeota archaeon]